jgi:DNA-binding CsgD family transcriptional regulator
MPGSAEWYRWAYTTTVGYSSHIAFSVVKDSLSASFGVNADQTKTIAINATCSRAFGDKVGRVFGVPEFQKHEFSVRSRQIGGDGANDPVVGSGCPEVVAVRSREPDGATGWVELRLFDVESAEDGRLVACSVQDVTEHRFAVEQMKLLLDRLPVIFTVTDLAGRTRDGRVVNAAVTCVLVPGEEHRCPSVVAILRPRHTAVEEIRPILLTDNEIAVLELEALGLSNEETAGQLGITRRGVDYQLRSLARKLRCANNCSPMVATAYHLRVFDQQRWPPQVRSRFRATTGRAVDGRTPVQPSASVLAQHHTGAPQVVLER